MVERQKKVQRFAKEKQPSARQSSSVKKKKVKMNTYYTDELCVKCNIDRSLCAQNQAECVEHLSVNTCLL